MFFSGIICCIYLIQFSLIEFCCFYLSFLYCAIFLIFWTRKFRMKRLAIYNKIFSFFLFSIKKNIYLFHIHHLLEIFLWYCKWISSVTISENTWMLPLRWCTIVGIGIYLRKYLFLYWSQFKIVLRHLVLLSNFSIVFDEFFKYAKHSNIQGCRIMSVHSYQISPFIPNSSSIKSFGHLFCSTIRNSHFSNE